MRHFDRPSSVNLLTQMRGSGECYIVRGQQRREITPGEKAVFGLALAGQGIETLQRLVDESRVTHHKAVFRQVIEELAHQRAEVGLCRKIVGTGKGGVELQPGARGALTELRAQNVEQQRLRGAEPLYQRLQTSALAHPSARGAFPDGAQEAIAHLRKQLRMLMTIDEIRCSAEQILERCELHHQ